MDYYVFILELIIVFNELGKDNCETIREKNMFWDFVQTYIRDLTAYCMEHSKGIIKD